MLQCAVHVLCGSSGRHPADVAFGIANTLASACLRPTSWGRSRRGGQRGILTGAEVGKPYLPCVRLIGPFCHLDAPGWRLGRQEIGCLALLCGKAARGRCSGRRNQFVGVDEDVPNPRRPIAGGGDDEFAVWAKSALNTRSGWRITAIGVRKS
jgi:hypothetical protein